MSGLLIFISVVAGTISFLGLFHPPARKRSFYVWLASFLLLVIAVPKSTETQSTETNWSIHEYKILEAKNIDFLNRTRRTVRVTAPTAETDEDKIATLMDAVLEVHRKDYPQFIGAALLPFEGTFGILATIDYASDGCGVSGDDCTGEMWTNAYVSSSPLTSEQLDIGKEWASEEDRFRDPDGIVDDAGLKKFLAEKRGVDVDYISSELVGFITATIADKEIELPDDVKNRGAMSDAEKEKMEEMSCRYDIQCWGERHLGKAEIYCAPAIEKLAIFDHEWTDGFLESTFDRLSWGDKSTGVISYNGRKIKLQSEFGDWVPASYWCRYDPNTNEVSVEVYTGN